MASSWGLSWGKAWGNAWGMLSPKPPAIIGHFGGDDAPKRKPREIRKIYDVICETRLAPVVQKIVVPFKQGPKIDWAAVARNEVVVAKMLQVYRQALAEQDDEEVLMLCLL
jgi:hypothetical protein